MLEKDDIIVWGLAIATIIVAAIICFGVNSESIFLNLSSVTGIALRNIYFDFIGFLRPFIFS